MTTRANTEARSTQVNEVGDSWPQGPGDPSRSDLLAEACFRQPRRFHQIEGCTACHGEHPYPDVDGDMVSAALAVELSHDVDVRVLIRPDLDRQSRLRLLAKILEGEAYHDWEDQEPAPASPRRCKPMPGLELDDDDDLL